MAFARRVVTGPGGIVADGPPPLTVDIPDGFGASELLWFEAPPVRVVDGVERADGGFPLEPPPGGASVRIVRAPATGGWMRVGGDDDDRPGWHSTDTLDFVVILEGEITLGTVDAETRLRTGDFVVQRGAHHRWRTEGDEPCTYLVVMLRPEPGAPVGGTWTPGTGDGPRRVITGPDGTFDAAASSTLAAGIVRLADLWHTLGPLRSVTQGGDVAGPWALDGAPGGALLRFVEFAPGGAPDEGWHRTHSIDIDVVISGRLRLDLDGGVTTELGPGEAVVQRGTNHRWEAVGDEPVRFAAIMFALP